MFELIQVQKCSNCWFPGGMGSSLFNIVSMFELIQVQKCSYCWFPGGMGSSQTSGKMQGFGNMLQPKREYS